MVWFFTVVYLSNNIAHSSEIRIEHLRYATMRECIDAQEEEIDYYRGFKKTGGLDEVYVNRKCEEEKGELPPGTLMDRVTVR